MLQKANVLITGPPGSGKSTLISRVISLLRNQGIKVGGISTPDFRLPSGRRGGFLICDVATGKKGTMAASDVKSAVRVGRYGVNVDIIQEIGVTAIEQAITDAELIIIDEIGKMELAVQEFKQIVTQALNSPKPVLGTIGMKIQSPFVNAIKQRSDVNVLLLPVNKQSEVYQRVLALLGILSIDGSTSEH